MVVLVWSVALAEGCANEFGALPGDDAVEVKPLSISIEELHKRMVSDDAFEIPGSPVIRGSVTANDLSGNFYRSFVVEQDGFAVEVLEGSRSLASRYAEGAVVVISLEGLWMARSSGVLQVGVEASSTSS